MATIQALLAREILDSRGNPTLETDVILSDGSFGRAAVPSGASTGAGEARELRDNDHARYRGRGVLRAVNNVNGEIWKAVRGFDAHDQRGLDTLLNTLDGTQDKGRLGANAILSVSLAVCRAAAVSRGVPLYEYIGVELLNAASFQLPVPMFNILNGGLHANNTVDFQEFMIAPVSAPNFREALRMASEAYHALKARLGKAGYDTSVADEGGFAPHLESNTQALEFIVRATESAGFKPGKDIVIALDPAASGFYRNGCYHFDRSDRRALSAADMIDMYAAWIRAFPIASIEDGLAECDREGWKALTEALGDQVQLVGDDIFVTNPVIIQQAIIDNIANASLIKLNQIGTLTETMTAITLSKKAGYGTVVSHRSGETPDDFIADLAVAASTGQIKSGAPCRGERLAKYNQLMRIEESLGRRATFAGPDVFKACLFRTSSKAP